MEKFLHEAFHSATDGQLSLPEITQNIKIFLSEDSSSSYSLFLGSDSHERIDDKGKHYIQAVTAIVVHRKGFGGKYFWYKGKKSLVYSLREKIYRETMQSLDIARVFVPMLQYNLDDLATRLALEIHVDVGAYGETRDMIREVVGMVTGFGFVAKTKPDFICSLLCCRQAHLRKSKVKSSKSKVISSRAKPQKVSC